MKPVAGGGLGQNQNKVAHDMATKRLFVSSVLSILILAIGMGWTYTLGARANERMKKLNRLIVVLDGFQDAEDEAKAKAERTHR